jgi:hypothetical protein
MTLLEVAGTLLLVAIVAGIVAGLAGVGMLLQGSLLTGAAALLIVVGLLPLAPFLLLGLLLVLLVRLSRRRPAPAARG